MLGCGRCGRMSGRGEGRRSGRRGSGAWLAWVRRGGKGCFRLELRWEAVRSGCQMSDAKLQVLEPDRTWRSLCGGVRLRRGAASIAIQPTQSSTMFGNCRLNLCCKPATRDGICSDFVLMPESSRNLDGGQRRTHVQPHSGVPSNPPAAVSDLWACQSGAESMVPCWAVGQRSGSQQLRARRARIPFLVLVTKKRS
jgi:hypothetical protein